MKALKMQWLLAVMAAASLVACGGGSSTEPAVDTATPAAPVTPVTPTPVTPVPPVVSNTSILGFGMPAYWGDSAAAYAGKIPSQSFVIVNPNSGALGLTPTQVNDWKAVIASIRAQGGKAIGYIPTGYAQLTTDQQNRYAEIDDNIQAYSVTLGGVDGYFFDEAAFDDGSFTEQQKCDGTPLKFDAVRSMLSAAGESAAVTVWNSGWSGMNGCFVASAHSGEHVVIYETSYANYQTDKVWLNTTVQDLAESLGVKTWLLVHSATQPQMLDVIKNTRVNYAYVTDIAYDPMLPYGGPIWNSVPVYWGEDTTLGSERGCLKDLQNGGSC